MSEGEQNTLLGGRYVIDGLVESGGRGEIYVAHRTGPHDFERKVAIKRIRESLSDDPVAVERFLREANLAAQLHHPNIVEIMELGNELGEHYIVMELLRGKTLRAVLERLAQRGRLCPPGIVARVVKGVAEALDYAHNFAIEGEPRPIVHRDVNLENIMLTHDDQVKLLDFGLARDLGDVAAVTNAGELLGQPVYLPPECVSGTSSAPPRDVYSLGVVCFMALSGSSPYPTEPGPAGLAKLFHAITDGPSPQLPGGLPMPLVELTTRAMFKDPAVRPDAREMADELGEYIGSDPQIAASRISALLEELFADDVEAAPLPVLDGGLGARPHAEPISEHVMAVGDDDLIEIGTTELEASANAPSVDWADDIDGPGSAESVGWAEDVSQPAPEPVLVPDEEEPRAEPVPRPSSTGEDELAGWGDEPAEEKEDKKKKKKKKPKGATEELPTVDGRVFRFRLWLGRMRRRAISVLRWGTVAAAIAFCVYYWDILGPTVKPYLEIVKNGASSAGSWIGARYDDAKEFAKGPPPPPSQLPVIDAPPGQTAPGAAPTAPGAVPTAPVAGAGPAEPPPPPDTGVLQIRCRWGWVKIDGRTVGNCPQVIKELPVGNHTVTFERAAGVVTKQIRISKNRMLKLDLVPKRRDPGEFEIGLEDGPLP